MKNFVIIVPASLDKRNYERFGIEKLRKKYNAKVLDFTLCYRPDYLSQTSIKVINDDEYYLIKSKDDFLKIKFSDEKLFLLDLSYPNINPIFKWVRRFFKNKKCITIHHRLNLLPVGEIIFSKQIYNLFNHPKKTIHKIITFINRFIYKKIAIQDIVLFGGLLEYEASKAKYKIKAHAMDYDVYLKVKDKDSVKKEPYVVFLDEDLVFHPDYILADMSKSIIPEEYYKRLKIFFQKFEKETKLKVKLTMHPKFDFNNFKGEKYDFDMSQGKTAELVKNCTAVLLHSSSSVSFAILFEKPVIYLHFKEFDNGWLGSYLNALKKLTGGELIDVDDHKKRIDMNDLTKINKLKYNKYIDTYIKFPGSPDKELVDILVDFLDKNFIDLHIK